jgi:hypothetical protein
MLYLSKTDLVLWPETMGDRIGRVELELSRAVTKKFLGPRAALEGGHDQNLCDCGVAPGSRQERHEHGSQSLPPFPRP